MATLNWYVVNNAGTTLNVGLRKYKLIGANGQTTEGEISSATFSNARALKDGGSAVMGCGITGLLCAVTGMILVAIFALGRQFWYLQWIAVVLFFVGGFLLMLGGVLYANKLFLDWSFILFQFCGPAIMGAAVLMLYAIAVGGSGPKTARV